MWLAKRVFFTNSKQTRCWMKFTFERITYLLQQSNVHQIGTLCRPAATSYRLYRFLTQVDNGSLIVKLSAFISTNAIIVETLLSQWRYSYTTLSLVCDALLLKVTASDASSRRCYPCCHRDTVQIEMLPIWVCNVSRRMEDNLLLAFYACLGIIYVCSDSTM